MEILKVSRQCVLLTNFSFQVLVLRNHIFSVFWTPLWTALRKHGAPYRDLTRLFFLFFPFFGCVLEETRGATFLEVASEVLSAGRNVYIRVIVIELWVIKGWWKIKFKKQKRYSSACFFSFKPALTNLNKLDFVVTELFFGTETIKVEQHSATSTVYFFSTKAISNLTSFISETLDVTFIFLLEHQSPPQRRLFGRALSRPRTPNVCSQEVRFRSTFSCVPEETHGCTYYDWKTYAFKKLVLDVPLAVFLKKRMAALITTEKRMLSRSSFWMYLWLCSWRSAWLH